MKNNIQLLMFDIILFLVSIMEAFDTITRIIASLGGIVVLLLSIRKLQQDSRIKKLEKRELELSIEIKEQELGRELIKNKELL